MQQFQKLYYPITTAQIKSTKQVHILHFFVINSLLAIDIKTHKIIKHEATKH